MTSARRIFRPARTARMAVRVAMFVFGATCLALPQTTSAQELTDVVAFFAKVRAIHGSGTARKTKPVDVRPAQPGEIVVSIIKGEGKETQSPPAKSGDMVVRNRCPQTGNEEILVPAASFKRRYEGPIGSASADGWAAYRPRGVEMSYIVIPGDQAEFVFMAPWGEKMRARPGDILVQDPSDPSDTYRIARISFECTYEVVD